MMFLAFKRQLPSQEARDDSSVLTKGFVSMLNQNSVVVVV